MLLLLPACRSCCGAGCASRSGWCLRISVVLAAAVSFVISRAAAAAADPLSSVLRWVLYLVAVLGCGRLQVLGRRPFVESAWRLPVVEMI